jgi:hypothetical protein
MKENATCMVLKSNEVCITHLDRLISVDTTELITLPSVNQKALLDDEEGYKAFTTTLENIKNFYKEKKYIRTCFISYAWPMVYI